MKSFDTLELIESSDIDHLIAVLQDADESIGRIRDVLTDSATVSYEILLKGDRAGAIAMHWLPDTSEILYIALNEAARGRGMGRASMMLIEAEARRRGVQSLLVGTSNASLGTIMFYQKCGFRMDSVRRDHFNYFTAPVYENSIRLRDMLMLRRAMSQVEWNE